MTTHKTLFAAAVLAVCGLVTTGGAAQAQSYYGKSRTDKKVAALMDEAKKLKAAGEYDDALDKLEAVLDLDPRNVSALVETAWIHNEQKDYDEAKDAAGEAVLIDFMNAGAWRELGYADWKLGDLKEAKANLKLAVDCDPKDISAYGYLIQVLEENGEKRAAKKMQKLKEEAELLVALDTPAKTKKED